MPRARTAYVKLHCWKTPHGLNVTFRKHLFDWRQHKLAATRGLKPSSNANSLGKWWHFENTASPWTDVRAFGCIIEEYDCCLWRIHQRVPDHNLSDLLHNRGKVRLLVTWEQCELFTRASPPKQTNDYQTLTEKQSHFKVGLVFSFPALNRFELYLLLSTFEVGKNILICMKPEPISR